MKISATAKVVNGRVEMDVLIRDQDGNQMTRYTPSLELPVAAAVKAALASVELPAVELQTQ